VGGAPCRSITGCVRRKPRFERDEAATLRPRCIVIWSLYDVRLAGSRLARSIVAVRFRPLIRHETEGEPDSQLDCLRLQVAKLDRIADALLDGSGAGKTRIRRVAASKQRRFTDAVPGLLSETERGTPDVTRAWNYLLEKMCWRITEVGRHQRLV
jgi:hypothetical protein